MQQEQYCGGDHHEGATDPDQFQLPAGHAIRGEILPASDRLLPGCWPTAWKLMPRRHALRARRAIFCVSVNLSSSFPCHSARRAAWWRRTNRKLRQTKRGMYPWSGWTRPPVSIRPAAAAGLRLLSESGLYLSSWRVIGESARRRRIHRSRIDPGRRFTRQRRAPGAGHAPDPAFW